MLYHGDPMSGWLHDDINGRWYRLTVRDGCVTNDLIREVTNRLLPVNQQVRKLHSISKNIFCSVSGFHVQIPDRIITIMVHIFGDSLVYTKEDWDTQKNSFSNFLGLQHSDGYSVVFGYRWSLVDFINTDFNYQALHYYFAGYDGYGSTKTGLESTAPIATTFDNVPRSKKPAITSGRQRVSRAGKISIQKT